MLYGYVRTKPKSEIVTMKMVMENEWEKEAKKKSFFFFFGENNFISSRDM